MIMRLGSWWRRHGASHRENIDTSSLRRSCRESPALRAYSLNRSDLWDAERPRRCPAPVVYLLKGLVYRLTNDGPSVRSLGNTSMNTIP
jgi:hypothetical protein